MITNIRSLLVISACASLALFSGCATATPQVNTRPDATVAYGDYKTFMMLKPSTMSAIGNSAATPTLVREVRQEAEAAFLAKGLTKSTDAYADMLVLVHGGVAEKIDVQDYGLSYARFGRRQEFNQYKEGSLFIDVFDGKSRELIWRGSITAEIGEIPEPAKVREAVSQIVARYPN